MMSILTKFQHLYEVLLRFDETGKLQGAHVQYLEGIAEDGAIVSAKTGPAIPLSLADKADGPTLKGVLGTAASALLAAKEAAEADATAARAEFKAKDDNAQALLATIEGLRAELDAAAASEAGKLREELAAKDATAQALLSQVADLEAALAAKA